MYIPRARIRHGQQIILAQHRQHKREIVNIQCHSVDQSRIKDLLETISQLSHPIFPRLLESYYDVNHLYLVWDPIEIKVDNILTARWPANETELACILRSVSVTGGHRMILRLWILRRPRTNTILAWPGKSLGHPGGRTQSG